VAQARKTRLERTADQRARPDCVFCRIVAGEAPVSKVFEDARTLAFMDVNPVRRGHVLVIPKAHKAQVWGMYVAERARGHGVARELLLAALATARATPGVAKVTLSVDSQNVAAIALYESLGFVVFAREADAVRLDGQSRDDLQMHLRLDTAP